MSAEHLPIKVLGIAASPRRGGNSAYLLEHALEAAREAAPAEVTTITWTFAGKVMSACTACDACNRNGGTCTTDDDFHELRELWLAADAIIYSTPVYHMACPSQLRAFMDRLGTTILFLFSDVPGEPVARRLLKPIGAIVQGNGFASGQEQAQQQIVAHATLMGCLPVSGEDWEANLGAAGWTAFDTRKDALRSLVDAGDPIAAATVRASQAVGRSAVALAQLVLAGAQARDDVLAGKPLYEVLRRRVKAGRGTEGDHSGASPKGEA